MDTGSLNMLHNTGDQNIGAVADRVNFNFLSLQILVNQNGVILCDPVDDIHEFLNLLIGDGNLHALSAKHVGGSHKNRIP